MLVSSDKKVTKETPHKRGECLKIRFQNDLKERTTKGKNGFFTISPLVACRVRQAWRVLLAKVAALAKPLAVESVLITPLLPPQAEALGRVRFCNVIG